MIVKRYQQTVLIGLILANLSAGLLISLPAIADGGQDAVTVLLGRAIFMDTTLSEPAGQACSSCHRPEKNFADPGQIVSAGANPTLFGNRNAPSISYVRFNPEPSW